MGGQCEECFAVWSDAFHWMEWAAFCAQATQNEAFRGVVKLTKSARTVGQPLYPQQTVEEERSRHLEIRQAAQILNEDELRKALGGMKRLPAHMKSIPTLTIQRERESDGTVLQDGASEVVYCFQDPTRPYRTATLVTKLGFACKTDHMANICGPSKGARC